MALKQQLQATLHVLLLITVMPLATAQSLELVYHGRSQSGAMFQPGDNRITLKCRRDSIAVLSPQIWVERSGLPRQPVTIVNYQNGRVTIVITQDLEGLYSCSDNGYDMSNRLEFVAFPEANPLIRSPYPFQAGRPATINCQIMPGRLRQYYSVTWWNGSSTIARSNPHSELLRDVLPGYQLHDNFSLTINDVQLSDSSTNYRCSVTIDDPQISGTTNAVYNQNQLGNITVVVYDPPSIVIPLEPRVISVIGGVHPNTTFICEATRVPACTPRISWIHNGRNTSQTVAQRFQAYSTSISARTVRSRLNATQLRGRDSGRIDCVAYCMVDVPGKQPLVLTTFRNTTLSVLTGDFETVVTVTTAGDVFIRITFQDGYRILDQTRLLMKYTDEGNTSSRNMTSEEAYMNTSRILLEVPRSRLPYQRFRVDVALQVGGEVGPFVSDGRVHDITQRRITITIGVIGGAIGGAVVIGVMLTFVICFLFCVIVKCINSKRQLKQEQVRQTGETNREQVRQTEETNREQVRQTEETNREQVRQTEETNREQVRQTEETDRVEMQELGETNRQKIQAIKELMQSLIDQGMNADETRQYLDIFKKQVDYIKEEVKKKEVKPKQVKEPRVVADEGEINGEEEKQKIYAEFLEYMHELCVSEQPAVP